MLAREREQRRAREMGESERGDEMERDERGVIVELSGAS